MHWMNWLRWRKKWRNSTFLWFLRCETCIWWWNHWLLC